MRARHTSGFTLIELMVTVAVLAIIATLAVPSFADFFEKYRLRQAAERIVSTLAEARMAAVKANVPVRVKGYGSGSAWCLGASAAETVVEWSPKPTTVTTACTCLEDTSCPVGGQSIRFSVDEIGAYKPTVTASGLDVTFDPKLGIGQATPVLPPATATGAAPLELTGSRSNFKLKIEMNGLGQGRVCVPSNYPVFGGYALCSS